MISLVLWDWCFNTEVTWSICMGSTTLVGWFHSKLIMHHTLYTLVFNYEVYSNKNKAFIVFTRKQRFYFVEKVFGPKNLDNPFYSHLFAAIFQFFQINLKCELWKFHFSWGYTFESKKRVDCFLEKGVMDLYSTLVRLLIN